MPEKSVNEIPRDLRPLFTKGNDALARENFDYAINLFHQVLAREPAVVDCRKALRKAQMGKADAKGGGGGFFKKVFSSAGSAPQVAKAQMALGKNPVEAMAIAEQVLDSDPTNSSAHRVIVGAATALELPQTIVMSLEVIVQHSPKDKAAVIHLANALADIGNVKRAEQVLAEPLRLFPGDADLAQALKNISARRTLVEGGYNELAKGDGSYRDILRNEQEAVELEQEQRTQKTEDTAERLIAEYEARLQKEAEPAQTPAVARGASHPKKAVRPRAHLLRATQSHRPGCGRRA